MQVTRVLFLGRKDPLEKEMATHSRILAWRIPMDRGAWQALVHGVIGLDTPEATEPGTHCFTRPTHFSSRSIVSPCILKLFNWFPSNIM